MSSLSEIRDNCVYAVIQLNGEAPKNELQLELLGTAFAFGQNDFLIANHVRKASAQHDEYFVNAEGEILRAPELLAYSEKEDYSILKLPSRRTKQFISCDPGSEIVGMTSICIGFAGSKTKLQNEEFDKKDGKFVLSRLKVEPTVVDGIIIGVEPMKRLSYGSSKEVDTIHVVGDHNIEGGFSGGPIILSKTLEAVAVITAHSLTNTKTSRQLPVVGTYLRRR